MDMQFPAYLKATTSDTLNANAAAGIDAFVPSPRISYRGGRFHLVDQDGVETRPMVVDQDGVVQEENNSVAIDVVIVGALPHISKIYYDQPYNPDADQAPACFSDNGVGPSDRSRLPQSETCAICPHNVWGSTFNPATGKARQACMNHKKLAVVRFYDDTNTVYSLTIPGASLKPYQAEIENILKHGIRLAGVVWRVSFDTSVAFPKLVFKSHQWVEQKDLPTFEAAARGDDARLAIGADDRAMPPAVVIQRKAALEAQKNPQLVSKPLPSEYRGPTVQVGPERPQAVSVAPPPPMGEKQALAETVRRSFPPAEQAMPADDRMHPTPAPADVPQHTIAALSAPTPPASEPEPPRRGRGRPRKVEPTLPQQLEPLAPAPTTGTMPAIPSFMDRREKQPSGLSETSPEIDEGLAAAMRIET